MNGVHDMGGQHGHGPVVAERDEPVFHHPWEGRVYALMRLVRLQGIFNLDEMRRAIESLPPADYLDYSYYERWLAALEALLAEKGVAHNGPMRPTGPKPPPSGVAPPRFAPGDRVRTRNFNPRRHTRLPRYARGRTGVVESVRAAYTLPDVNAHISGPEDRRVVEHVYVVAFEASELWGDDGAVHDKVGLDLWESYLEPLEEAGR
ncbi:MAG TPA: SH3-like domain-containing protein [Candidatus Dormibacteraeota bacterium]